MHADPPVVISASRRTDIPSHYMPWLMTQLERGFVETVNPYNRHRKKVSATPDTVHSIVFWSKNYGPFLKGHFGEKLQDKGYRIFFHFTVNSASDLLENEVPGLAERLDQAAELCRRFDSQAVTWRFDPILFYQRKAESKTQHNLEDFNRISAKMATHGVQRCVTSFADPYQKAVRRMARAGQMFVEPDYSRKQKILLRMADRLNPLGIELSVCCEKEVLEKDDGLAQIKPAACIDHPLLQKLFGGELSFQQDTGQRKKEGCQCYKAIDVGDYAAHPCYHHCLYCYANPVSPSTQKDRGVVS